uniref:leucine--tRNA ligase n=1 Tax=Graphocephala atropunctata TaxID=36148 RepID=A0A1B6LKZ8_9HEMI
MMKIKSLKTLVSFNGGNNKIISLWELPVISGITRCFHQQNDTGLNTWEEELTQATKLKIEEYWKDKLQYPEFDSDKEDSKFYVLSMFPYPSGNLHMGHIRVYSISDTLARFYRMSGKNVLHPMGWDAFGLPAENAAIERGLSSEVWTNKNISTMREQLKRLGCTFDWSREMATCHRDYYKFTQMIFLKMYKQGLVYQKKALVNWDPVDQTVLADEQVDDAGCSWRSGAKVEKKILKQWFIRTTSFSKALYDGLDRKDLEDWKDIIDMQKGWIGNCDGVSFEFPLHDGEGEVTLWTDYPELLPRAKFVAFSPGSVFDIEHEGDGNRKLDVSVRNTLTGELLPVYITDELPFHEGSEARIGIPDVHECDLTFAQQVGIRLDNTGQDKKLDREASIKEIKGRVTSSKIRDWLISRQRHWGTPIPMVHCSECGVQPVPLDQLPVNLPSAKTVPEKGVRLSCPEEWISTTCPNCGGPARRDRDTMDTFVDSSWYYLRYLDPHNQQEPFSTTTAAKLMPVDIYIGGKEHAVLHLYYARFMSYFLHSVGWLPDPEPFKRLLVQGMVMGRTYRVQATGKYIPASEVDSSGKKAVEKSSGQTVVESWDKMSKSKHNGVDPSQMFAEYGIDSTRLLMMGSVAPTSQRNWDDATFAGVLNWQRKLWLTVQEFRTARSAAGTLRVPEDLAAAEASLRDSRNYHLRGISISYRVSHQFNRVISKMQGLTGNLRRFGPEYKAHCVEFERALAMQVVALAPLAPHFSAELWAGLATSAGLKTAAEFDWSRSAHLQAWPRLDSDYKRDFTCSVNTAVKDTLKISEEQLNKMTESSAAELALSSPQVRLYTDQSPVLQVNLKLYPGLCAAVDLSVDHTKLRFDKEHYNKRKQARKKAVNK